MAMWAAEHSTAKCKIKILHYNKQESADMADMSTTLLELDSDKDIIWSATVEKTSYSPVGQFSIELPNDRHWSNFVSAGDWIGIYLHNANMTSADALPSLRTIGTISKISRKYSLASNGAPDITWVVTGYDMGKIFQSFQFLIDPQLAQDKQAAGLVLFQNGLIEGSSSMMIGNWISFYLKNSSTVLKNLGPAFENGFKAPPNFAQTFYPKNASVFSQENDAIDYIYDLLQFDIYDNSAYEWILYTNIDTSYPMWTILKMLSNMAINELFIEMSGPTGRERPTVFFRPYPYCLKSYSDDPQLYINATLHQAQLNIDSFEVLDANLGNSESDRYNMFKIFSTFNNNGMGSSYLVAPEINSASNQRYGPCIFRAETQYLDQKASSVTTPTQVLAMWQRLVKHWYENNHLLEVGNLTINGRADARVGKTLLLSNWFDNSAVKRMAYIEGCVDQFRYPNTWTQSLLLTRGMILDQNGQERYSYSFLSKHNIQEIGWSTALYRNEK